MIVEVKARQTLLDIATSKGGTLETLFDVARLNGMSITDDLRAGQHIISPGVQLEGVAEYFRIYKIDPASATTTVADLVPQGIEFWGIENDFIIS